MTELDRRVARAEYQELLNKVGELEQAERVQRALYAISDLAGAQLEMPDLLKRLHGIISGLMYAENFLLLAMTAHYSMFGFFITPMWRPHSRMWQRRDWMR